LFGMLIYALLAVFVGGLMVGRTPEFLGKKIQAAEMKLITLYLLLPAVFILVFAGAAVVIKTALASRLNSGPHGLTEIVYAYTEAFNNNGSAFGGLSANTQWYDTTLAIVMLVGRLFPMIIVLAIAGSLGRKRYVPSTTGTFETTTPLFGGLLLGVVVIVVGLTYFPVLALGPIVEHLAGHF
jgi:K+-transporting ATPase ATPase A chain